jgi:hypothetical protein
MWRTQNIQKENHIRPTQSQSHLVCVVRQRLGASSGAQVPQLDLQERAFGKWTSMHEMQYCGWLWLGKPMPIPQMKVWEKHYNCIHIVGGTWNFMPQLFPSPPCHPKVNDSRFNFSALCFVTLNRQLLVLSGNTSLLFLHTDRLPYHIMLCTKQITTLLWECMIPHECGKGDNGGDANTAVNSWLHTHCLL